MRTSPELSVPQFGAAGKPTTKKALTQSLQAAGFRDRLDALMQVIRFGPEFLPGAEFLALLFHVERSLPYCKTSDTASLKQMERGIRKRGGGYIRGGSGLGLTSAKRGNLGLAKLGLLERKVNPRAREDHKPTEYMVKWDTLQEFFAGKLEEKARSKMDQGARSKMGQGLGPKWATQSSSSSERKEKQKKRDGRGKREVAGGKPDRPEEPRKTSSSLRVDDDEKPRLPEPTVTVERKTPQSDKGASIPKPDGTPTPEPASRPEESPEERFRRELVERHGQQVDVEKILALVRGEDDLGTFDKRFPDFAAAECTNPKAIKNPEGFYRKTARKFWAERKYEAVVQLYGPPISTVDSTPPTVDIPEGEKCGECGCRVGRGLVDRNGRIEPCPSCTPSCPACERTGWTLEGVCAEPMNGRPCVWGRCLMTAATCKTCFDLGWYFQAVEPDVINPDGRERMDCDCAAGRKLEAETRRLDPFRIPDRIVA